MAEQVALLGHPVAHSLSGAMQQAAFDSLGIDATYDWNKVALKLTMEHPSQTGRPALTAMIGSVTGAVGSTTGAPVAGPANPAMRAKAPSKAMDAFHGRLAGIKHNVDQLNSRLSTLEVEVEKTERELIKGDPKKFTLDD